MTFYWHPEKYCYSFLGSCCDVVICQDHKTHLNSEVSLQRKLLTLLYVCGVSSVGTRQQMGSGKI